MWIEYAGGLASDVRAVFARPGVVVSTGGKAGLAYFRAHGAATTFFVLHMNDLVGGPNRPADPASISATAAALLSQAVDATACPTPVIALNELNGGNLPAPWSETNAVYRADVLALLQQLATGGARPVLLVHGDFTVAGETADWWRQVAQSSDLVEEVYYDGSRIHALGPVMGNRRMRMGIRNVIDRFESIGIPPARIGIMLGFHAERVPGIGGRQGLEPREAWLRVVKWEARTAQEVASETRIASIWSWGWAGFSGEDPDKASAACVYLWARDRSLCDGRGVGGPAFNSSLTEGQMVLPAGVSCTFAGGQVKTTALDELAALTRDRHSALSALFARLVLQRKVPVSLPQELAAEQRAIKRSFHGKRGAYLRALTRAHASLAVARAIIGDELRRHAIAGRLAASGSTQTTLEWTADQEARAVDTAICARDELPGAGGFPQTNAREVGVVPLLAKLPFLFADRTPPAPPAAAKATGEDKTVVINWRPGREADLAGYQVYRSEKTGYVPIGPFLDRPMYVDASALVGTRFYYIVRAVDTSGNFSDPSAEVSAVSG